MAKPSIKDFFVISLASIYDKIRREEKDVAIKMLNDLKNNLRLLSLDDRLEIALEISSLFAQIGELDSAEDVLFNVIEGLEEISEDEEILRKVARIKAEIVKISLFKEKYPGDVLENALHLYMKLAKDEKSLIDLLSFLVALYSEVKKRYKMYASAKQAIKNALKKVDTILVSEVRADIHPYIAEALVMLAELEYETEEIKQSLEHLFQAMNIYLLLKQEKEALEIALTIADILKKHGSREKAIDFLRDFASKIVNREIKRLIENKIKKLSTH